MSSRLIQSAGASTGSRTAQPFAAPGLPSSAGSGPSDAAIVTDDAEHATEIFSRHRPFAAHTVDAWRHLLSASPATASGLINAIFLTGISQACSKKLALRLDLSRSSLHRLCWRQARCSVGALVRRAGFAVAVMAFADPEVRVGTLATFLGFSDSATLRRLVRRQSGLSIRELRQRVELDGSAVTLDRALADAPVGKRELANARA